MAAPTPQTRTEPSGERFVSGHRSTIVHSADVDVSLFEIAVGLPKISNGEEINITTMWNDDYQTFAEQVLNRLEPFTFRFAFGPDTYRQLLALTGVHGTITRVFPTGQPLTFYGYFKDFEFEDFVVDEQPEGSCICVPTLYDRTNWVEAAPLMPSPPPPPP